jgi:hypothetical protein
MRPFIFGLIFQKPHVPYQQNHQNRFRRRLTDFSPGRVKAGKGGKGGVFGLLSFKAVVRGRHSLVDTSLAMGRRR